MSCCRYGCLGYCWSTCLKSDTRGKDDCLRCVKLAGTLFPRDVSTLPWFKAAQDTVQAYQLGVTKTESEAKKKEEAPVRLKLAAEFEGLRIASENGPDKLLTHAYTLHPPKERGELRVTEAVQYGEKRYVSVAHVRLFCPARPMPLFQLLVFIKTI